MLVLLSLWCLGWCKVITSILDRCLHFYVERKVALHYVNQSTANTSGSIVSEWTGKMVHNGDFV